MHSDMQLEAAGIERASRSSRTTRRKSSASIGPAIVFIVIWLLLVAGGMAAAVWYAGELRARITDDIDRQTAAQIAAVQQEVEMRMDELKQSFNAELDAVAAKVDALNELLTFAKDNVTADTDNSNLLYTQIREVKEQLEQLQKQLDVLK